MVAVGHLLKAFRAPVSNLTTLRSTLDEKTQ